MSKRFLAKKTARPQRSRSLAAVTALLLIAVTISAQSFSFPYSQAQELPVQATTTEQVASSSTPSAEQAGAQAATSEESAQVQAVDSEQATTTAEAATSTQAEATTTASVDPGLFSEFDSFAQTSDDEGTTTVVTVDGQTSTTTATSTIVEGADGGAGTGTGGGVITTGDALLAADVANVINTNIVGATGTVLFVNRATGGDIVIDDAAFTVEADCDATSTCQVTSSTLEKLITNTNDAAVDNKIVVDADTGGNAVEQAQGQSQIITGNASAAANLINIINTNLISSEYVLLVLNNFGDLNGDVVLPGEAFFSFLSQAAATPSQSTTTITNVNDAQIANNATTTAVSGDNSVIGTDNSQIETGGAVTRANEHTIANTNLTAHNAVYILLHVADTWNGAITGLPAGLIATRMPEGVVIGVDPDFFAADTASSTDAVNSSTTITNDNQAQLNNDVDVRAATGENEIATVSTSSTGFIRSGNATAVSNIFNVVNTNIVGTNWLLAFVNIFGSFNGDLAFGRPDLWVGQQADLSRNPLTIGDTASITLTVKNRGNAQANDVRLRAGLTPSEQFNFVNTSGASTETQGLTWDLGTLAIGETRTIRFSAMVDDIIPPGASVATSTASISAAEHDGDPTDNTDSIVLTLSGPGPASGSGTGGGGGGGSSSGTGPSNAGSSGSSNSSASSAGSAGASTFVPVFSIKKTNNVQQRNVEPGEAVHFQIVFQNGLSGPIINAVIKDVLYDPFGTPVEVNEWPLQRVEAGEQITLDYDLTFQEDAVAGWYSNTAHIEGTTELGANISFIQARSMLYVNGLGVGGGDLIEKAGLLSPSVISPLSVRQPALARAVRPQSATQEPEEVVATTTSAVEPIGIMFARVALTDQERMPSGLASIYDIFGENISRNSVLGWALVLSLGLLGYSWWLHRRLRSRRLIR